MSSSHERIAASSERMIQLSSLHLLATDDVANPLGVHEVGREVPLQLAVKPDLHLVFLPVQLEVCPLPLLVRQPVLSSLVQATDRLYLFSAVCFAVRGMQLSVEKRARGPAVLNIFTNLNWRARFVEAFLARLYVVRQGQA